MKNKYLSVCFALVISGCSSRPFIVDASSQTIPDPPPGKAQIIFLEPTNAIAGAFLTCLVEAKGEERPLLAMLGSKAKSVQVVNPGHHTFVANTGASLISEGFSHILEADVDAGKRYYVLVRFIYGHGMQLRPVRATGTSDYSAGNPQFSEWITSTRIMEKTSEADAWYAKFKGAVDRGEATARVDWQKKSADQKAELTLNRDDAISK
jgi:hypothetical protein